MGRRRSGPGLEWMPVAQKMTEICFAAPGVALYRLADLCNPWPPTARRRRERVRMVQEKAEAVAELAVVTATMWPRLLASAADQSLAPVHRRVVANHRRLYRR